MLKAYSIMAPQALLPRADSMPQAPPHNGHGSIYYISQSHLYVSKAIDVIEDKNL